MAWQPLPEGENNFDFLVIGAGISGVNYAYRIQERCPWASYAVLEARHEMGGTWSLFNYPGIRSDSDLHTFGFAWRPWKENTSIAGGHLIKSYVNESAEMYGIDKHIRYNSKVTTAKYSTPDRLWTLEVTENGTVTKTYNTRWLLICSGYYDYDKPLQAQIPGIEDFKGQVIHPQFWPEDYDYTDKEVVIIGSGATAVTVLPAMAEKAKRVTMLQRSPGYIMALPSEDSIEWFIRHTLWWAPTFQRFLIRIKWIIMPMFLTSMSARFPNRIRNVMRRLTVAQLPKSIPHDPHFKPSYNPWEQRMCTSPDGDFFKCLREGKADIETNTIDNITADTIKLSDGKELHPDCIVTATGLQVKFGGGMDISIDGKPYWIPDNYVWKMVMLENLPNASFVVGYVDASWTLGADATAQLTTRMFNQMRKEGVTQVTARRSEDDKLHMKTQSILKLNSTYVTKGKSLLPKAGSRPQWLPRSNYITDILMAWYGDIRTNTEWVK